MRTIHIYEAFDGTQFKDDLECLSYEASLLHPSLMKIGFCNKNNDLFYIDKDKILMDDTPYQECEKLIIHSEEELKDLLWLSAEMGWCEYEDQINSPGFWEREDKGFGDAVWTKRPIYV